MSHGECVRTLRGFAKKLRHLQPEMVYPFVLCGLWRTALAEAPESFFRPSERKKGFHQSSIELSFINVDISFSGLPLARCAAGHTTPLWSTNRPPKQTSLAVTYPAGEVQSPFGFSYSKHGFAGRISLAVEYSARLRD